MKRMSCVFGIGILFGANLYASPISRMTEQRHHHTSSLLRDGRILVIGGAAGRNIHNSAEIFDSAVANAAWTRTNPLKQQRLGHTATVLNDGRVLVVGGYFKDSFGREITNTSEIFDPLANAGNGEWLPGPDLRSARAHHTANLFSDGRVLVVGGYGLSMSSEVFDPSANGGLGAWTEVAGPHENRALHSATTLKNGNILIVGGTDPLGGNAFVGSVETYDPNANAGLGAWTQALPLTLARHSHSAELLNDGRVVVIGGKVSDSESTTDAPYNKFVEMFEPGINSSSGIWSDGPQFMNPMFEHKSVLLEDGRILIIGGISHFKSWSNAEKATYIFDPSANAGKGQWLNGFDLSEARANFTVNQLENGDLLVIGGSGNGASISAVERLDSLGQSLLANPALIEPRSLHTATRLKNDRILIVGGEHTEGLGVIGSTEIFDPLAKGGHGGTVSSALLLTARSRHTASALADGRVLVVGGSTNRHADGSLTTTELYIPSGNGSLGQWIEGPKLNYSRSSHTATTLPDGRILVVGGFSVSPDGESRATQTAEIYTSDSAGGPGHWEPLPAMRVVRADHSATLLADGRVLVVGGSTGISNGTTSSYWDIRDTEIFDSKLNGGQGGWTEGPALNLARSQHNATLLPDGRVHVAGGEADRSSHSPQFAIDEIFDPAINDGKGAWAQGKFIQNGSGYLRERALATATTLLDGKVLIAGGRYTTVAERSLGPQDTMHVFSGQEYDWKNSTTFKLQYGRAGHTATLLSDGTVVILGGYSTEATLRGGFLSGAIVGEMSEIEMIRF